MKVLDYTTELYTLALKMVFSLQIEKSFINLHSTEFERCSIRIRNYVVIVPFHRKFTLETNF